jgi:hypothetical protein
MKFKIAVEDTPQISTGYRSGLQALESKDRKYIACDDTRVIVGSVDLDKHTKATYPEDPRWDYGIGIEIDSSDDRIVWLEVHPASTGKVDEVIKKHAWLKKWLTDSGSDLKRMLARYVWVASGKVAIAHHARQVKRLASMGILFAGSKYRIKSE